MRAILIDRYKNKTITTAEIVNDLVQIYPEVNKNTIIWNLNEMIKCGDIVRIGRGKYLFSNEPCREFTMPIYDDVKKVIDMISNQFKYVKIVLMDSKWLSDYLVQQPFSTVVKIEVNAPAVDAVVNLLRKGGWKAFSTSEIVDADKYFSETRIFVIDKIRFNNPTKKYENNIFIAKLEKVMVDVACEYEVFKQYQGWELENFYTNVTEKCAVNFSTVIKYASSRGRKEQIIPLLENSEKYQLFLRGSKDD